MPVVCQTGDSVSTRNYKIMIEVRAQKMSGIAMMELQSNNTIVGTIVTDFGIKVLDFYYYDRNTQIMNVIAPLNKWYIRKVLKKDLSLILTIVANDAHIAETAKITKAKRSIEKSNNGELRLTNHRYKIVYNLSPMNENNEVSE